MKTIELKKLSKEELYVEALKYFNKMTKQQLIKLIETKGLKNLESIEDTTEKNRISG